LAGVGGENRSCDPDGPRAGQYSHSVSIASGVGWRYPQVVDDRRRYRKPLGRLVDSLNGVC
jgi:hypothetical protein